MIAMGHTPRRLRSRQGQLEHGCSWQQGTARDTVLPQVGQPGVAQAGLEGAALGCAQHTAQQKVGAGGEPVARSLPGELLGGLGCHGLGPSRAARSRVRPGVVCQ